MEPWLKRCRGRLQDMFYPEWMRRRHGVVKAYDEGLLAVF